MEEGERGNSFGDGAAKNLPSSLLLQVCSPDGCEAQVAQAGIEGTKSEVNLEWWWGGGIV